jgi:MarR family transcriptional regulator, temperature-dependent positive regulator of motility
MSLIHTMPGHLIRRLNQISTGLFQDRMSALGFDLTPVQFAALATLRDRPDIDQATLAGLIAHDRATIGGVLDRLQAKGLVDRRTDPGDRRARLVRLSAPGQDLLSQVLPHVQALQGDILAGLSPEERDLFTALAARVARAGNALSRAPLVADVSGTAALSDEGIPGAGPLPARQ